MTLRMRYYGDPVLRRKAEPVETFDEDLKTLADAMVDTMRDESGIGLAGPQIGDSRRIFVMEIPADMDVDGSGARLNPELDGPMAVVNPEFVECSEEQDEVEEGCLSIPDVRGRVVRPVSVRMRFRTVEGEEREMELHGLAARCAQHETDHLDGVLFVDHLGSVKKMAIKGKLKKLKEKTLREGS